jgi:dolichol-phosphate mannosyltransferase
MTTTKTQLSVVIPLKNEADNIADLQKQLQQVALTLKPYVFEYVYIEDGSTDESATVIQELQTKNPDVRLIQLTRNFGKEIATTAGLHAAKGEAAIMIDADLQHPPELIPQFIARWEAGDDVVIGKQKLDNSYASFTKRVTARWFYRIINRISHTKVTPHATDFRLLDRAVIDEFNRFTEHNRLTRGLIDWLGFQRSYIEFTPAKRLHGDSSYSYRQLMRLATNSIVSLSFFPLKIAGYIGGVIVAVSTPLIIFIMGNHLFFGNSMKFTGSATLAAMLLFLVGIVLICQGLMALYVANIYGEVQNRPLYIEKRPRRRRK